ncbi:hypothetical protein D5273_01155 [Enterorhabdus caecimuris]|nr:hypothetical protein [Adlercreutzia caecimuris]
MGHLMNGGDTQTRRFAATVLDDYYDFTNRGGAYSKQIDWLHREFQENVKKGLYPRMSDAELGEYLMRETLLDNGQEDCLKLLFCGASDSEAI